MHGQQNLNSNIMLLYVTTYAAQYSNLNNNSSAFCQLP